MTVGRSAVRTSKSSWSSAASQSNNAQRAARLPNASSTASRASTQRLLGLGRGSDVSTSYNARASAAGAGTIAAGGDGGRESGGLIEKRVKGGVVGGVVLLPNFFLRKVGDKGCGDTVGGVGHKVETGAR